MNIYPQKIAASNSETAGKALVSLKHLFISESLKQMNMFKSDGIASRGVGQGTFESFLIDEYAKLIVERSGVKIKRSVEDE